MKEKIIETAGKTWRTLGERGESSASEIAKAIKENEDLVNQAIGWLAREDKISYATKRNEVVISLVNAEMEAFRRIYKNQPEKKTSITAKQKK